RQLKANAFLSALYLIRTQLPPLLADALHIHATTLVTDDLCRQHNEVGLKRERKAFSVEVDGELYGVALCETGSPILSLFNVLNMAFVFCTSFDGPKGLAAQAALLSYVVSFYERRGVEHPLIAAPPGTILGAEHAGLKRAETMRAWAATMDGVRQWRSFLR